MENTLPQRKKNRLQNRDYSECGVYFLTICAAERKNYFWRSVGAIIDRPQDVPLSHYGRIVEAAVQSIPEIYPAVEIDAYVIMPDHIHLLLLVHADDRGRPMVAPTVGRLIKQFKGAVTKQVGAPIWQKSFFDHVIRNKQDYEEHVKYIYENPLRWQYRDL